MSASAEDGLFPHFAQCKLALKFLLLGYGITSRGIFLRLLFRSCFSTPRRSFSGSISAMLTIQLVPLYKTNSLSEIPKRSHRGGICLLRVKKKNAARRRQRSTLVHKKKKNESTCWKAQNAASQSPMENDLGGHFAQVFLLRSRRGRLTRSFLRCY